MSGHEQPQQLPDFSRSAHQLLTTPLPFAKVAAPSASRLVASDFIATTSTGFRPVPFEPPRS